MLYEVKSFLIYSNKSISEIAFELYFSEPSHLNRFFKVQTGTTASTFRKTYQIG